MEKAVLEGSQSIEYLFQKGFLNLIIQCNILKGVLGDLFKLHAFFLSFFNKKSYVPTFFWRGQYQQCSSKNLIQIIELSQIVVYIFNFTF